jgi:hypothetical protein
MAASKSPVTRSHEQTLPAWTMTEEVSVRRIAIVDGDSRLVTEHYCPACHACTSSWEPCWSCCNVEVFTQSWCSPWMTIDDAVMAHGTESYMYPGSLPLVYCSSDQFLSVRLVWQSSDMRSRVTENLTTLPVCCRPYKLTLYLHGQWLCRSV